MRLTLRTLLAYLDDILPPAEAKELGEKIAASPVATQYVERIREVMRRRRLTAPETDGSGGGIEPNLVAEYLDNSLAPEKVADVERVCLESDINLAEVAASHQILTLVLGEPVEISGRLRERMYALGPQAASIDMPAGRNGGDMSAREQLAAIQNAQRPRPAPATKPLESRLPDYLKPKPLWKRLLPWAAIAAVVLLWLGVLAYDPTFFGGRLAQNTADDDKAVDDAPLAAPADEADTDAAPPAHDAVATEEMTDDVPSIAAVDRAELPIDPEPPSDDPVIIDDASDDGDSPEMTTPAPADVDESTDVVVAPAPAPRPAETTDVPPPADMPELQEPPTVDVVSTTGTVLRFDAPAKQWFPLGQDEVNDVGTSIAVPDPFEAVIDVGGFPLTTTVLGGTRFKTFGSTDAGPFGFDVAQGRLRLSALPAGAEKPDAAATMFALRLGNSLFRVEPLTPDTVFGIEVLPLQPTGVDQNLTSRTPQGVIYVGAGTVRLADASGRIAVASTGNRLILVPDGTGSIGVPPGGPGTPAPLADAASTTDAATETDAEALIEPAPEEPPAATAETGLPAAPVRQPDSAVDSGRGLPLPPLEQPEPAAAVAGEEAPVDGDETDAKPAEAPADAKDSAIAAGMPDWLTPREPTPAARRAMADFNDEFLAGAPVGQSLLPAVDSPLYYVAEPAAKALALIEDVDGMVKTLRDTEHQEATIAAIEGLRNWLGRSPANGPELRRQLELVFPRQGLADILYRMAWGYDRDDARNEATARTLVDWLDHNERVVREMAFYHVHRLSGRTMFYRPNQSSSDRNGAINRWRDFVNRNGGLVAQ